MVQPYDYWHVSGGGGYINSNNHAEIDESAGVFSYAPAVANVLCARPFFVGDSGVFMQKMGVSVLTASTGSVRLGIYANPPASAHDMYPTTLLADFGAVLVTAPTGVKYSASLAPGTLELACGYYWAALIAENAGGNFFTNERFNGSNNPMGMDSAGAPYLGWSVAQAYGAMPATFPSGAIPTPMPDFPAAANKSRCISCLIERE